MERDFLGLSSKGSSPLKEEASDDCNGSAPVRSSGMQWSFPKVSTVPQYLSFNAAQDDWPKKTVYDSPQASGVMSKSTMDAIDSNNKLHSAAVQTSLTPDKKTAGSHYTVTAYSLKPFAAHSADHAHDVKIYPVPTQPNQKISVTMNDPILQSHLASTGQNVVGSITNQLPLGGFQIVTPNSMTPSTSSILGTNDLRNASKPPGAPAQMTIFYSGSVSVYNDVPLEKAQAIMLLAGNGPSVSTPKTELSTSLLQAPVPNPPMTDIFARKQPHVGLSCVVPPSPVSSTVHDAPQLGAGIAGNNKIEAGKPVGTLPQPIKQSEPPKAISSSAPTLKSDVPQFRKASLARFLEKRKERLLLAMAFSAFNVLFL